MFPSNNDFLCVCVLLVIDVAYNAASPFHRWKRPWHGFQVY
jgi:hypothetical protein